MADDNEAEPLPVVKYKQFGGKDARQAAAVVYMQATELLAAREEVGKALRMLRRVVSPLVSTLGDAFAELSGCRERLRDTGADLRAERSLRGQLERALEYVARQAYAEGREAGRQEVEKTP